MANRGILYPFSIREGAPKEAKDETLVASALTQLLSQERGERVYNDNNGVSLLPYIFEQETALVAADIRREIVLAVAKYEPRVSVETVPVQYRLVDNNSVLEAALVWRYQGRVFSVGRELTNLSNLG